MESKEEKWREEVLVVCCVVVFFFNDTATTEIYTLSLHDALPILWIGSATLTGVVALAMLVVEGPLSSTTPAPSQGSGAEVVAPAR